MQKSLFIMALICIAMATDIDSEEDSQQQDIAAREKRHHHHQQHQHQQHQHHQPQQQHHQHQPSPPSRPHQAQHQHAPKPPQKHQTPEEALGLPANASTIRANIVNTFSCEGRIYGYYADVDNDCQLFHVCLPIGFPDGHEEMFRWSFICPTNTIFNQESFTCARVEDAAPCDSAPDLYRLNSNFGVTPPPAPPAHPTHPPAPHHYRSFEKK